MKRLLSGVAIIVLAVGSVSRSVAEDSPAPTVGQPVVGQWTPLFNGRDLTGWHTMLTGHGLDSDPNKLIQVHDGVIHMYADAPAPAEQPYGWICTKEQYSHYRVRFEYKWGEKKFAPRAESLRDAGCLYHVVAPKSVHGVWPMGIECQVQEGDTGDLITVDTACVAYVDPATKDAEYPNHMSPADGGVELENDWYINADKTWDRLEGWNTVEVVVRGADRARHIVNGHLNQSLKNMRKPDGKAWVPLEQGHIAFQLEGAEVEYRNIEIMLLDPAAKDDGDEHAAAAPAKLAEKLTADAQQVAPPDAGEVFTSADVLKTITVPEGFEVELIAEPPLVEHPMMGCLDDCGRLFIAESDGQNRQAQQLLDEEPHRILMLEDTDHDGDYDQRTVFADDLVLPNGAEWYDGALYVCSAPFVWRFRDLDGDGRAEERTRIAGTFNFDGMSSAFHGPVLGPDGRLYWSGGQHGWQFEDPTVGAKRPRANPKELGYDSGVAGPWPTSAPGAFSCWPDGSDGEKLASGAICNPVETTFTPEGEVIGTASVYDYDGSARRDAVLHWIDGGVFNLSEKNYAGLVRTGPILTPVTHTGHSAPSGIVRYRSPQFGAEYRDQYFFAEFNMHRVNFLRAVREGPTYRGSYDTFLSSTYTDTHFTDVMEDADGSLVVINTGGWFRYGCPTSQIEKPSILGAIYRVRRKDAARVEDPWGQTLAWDKATPEQLVTWLKDSRFAVRERAKLALTKRGSAALPALTAGLKNDSPPIRRECVWALTPMRSDEARAAVRTALEDAEVSVQLAALHSIAVQRDQQAEQKLIERLSHESAAIRREAATALGRIGSKSAVPSLLTAAASAADDSFLQHALTLALIRAGGNGATLPGLTDPSPRVARAALVALDQMHSGELTRQQLAELLERGDDALTAAALGVLRNRPEWADEMVGTLAGWLAEQNPTPERQAELRTAIRAFWNNQAVEELVGKQLQDESISSATRLLLLETVAIVDADKLPQPWSDAIRTCLASSDAAVKRQAIATIAARGLADSGADLEKLALAEQESDSLRLAAAVAYVRQAPATPEPILTLLIEQCQNAEESIERLAAAQAIAGATLTTEQKEQVLALVAEAESLELPVLVGAFEGNSAAEWAPKLVAALKQSPGRSALGPARLAKLLDGCSAEVQAAAKPLFEELGVQPVEQAEKLGAIIAHLESSNAHSGKQLFAGSIGACATCHTVNGQGGQIGPDLSKIAAIRTPRDLAEAIVYPSASFARGFEPVNVITLRGRTHSGYVCRETAEAIFLRGADRLELRVPRDSIDELSPAATSIMPQGFEGLFTAEQLRDLIAYLSTLK